MSTSLERMKQVRPYSSGGVSDEDYASHEKLLFERLVKAADKGVTSYELLQEGHYGMRPPNRVCSLRKRGFLIQTKREGKKTFRYTLIDATPRPKVLPQKPKKAEQQPLRGDWIADRVPTDGQGRPIQKKLEDCPLFAGAQS